MLWVCSDLSRIPYPNTFLYNICFGIEKSQTLHTHVSPYLPRKQRRNVIETTWRYMLLGGVNSHL